MPKDLKFSKQYILVKNKANLMLGIINRGIPDKSEVISKLYRSYARPHLEYCVQFWKPVNVKYEDMLEGYREEQLKLFQV